MLRRDELENTWELYGLRENPYSIQAIYVLGGIIPIESFVGREEQVSRLKRIVGSKGGSRTLVYGDIGVGKTSFVNVVRAQAYHRGFFTPFKEIIVVENWEIDDFIANTLSAIYASCKLLGDKKPLQPKTYSKLENLFEIAREEKDVGVSVAGFGGNYSVRKNTHGSPSTMSLIAFFQEVITEINKHTGKDVIIHYNNLELMPEKNLKRLFDNLRDFFQTPNVHFIFVGNLTVFSSMQSIPRFSSILTDSPIKIENLSIEEIKTILKIRMEKMRISEKITYTVPHTDSSLQSLYELYKGNIRNILNSLSTAVLSKTTERAIRLDEFSLCTTLRSILEDRYLSNLPNRARDVLLEVVKHDEITNKSISDKLHIARSNVSGYLKDLEKEGCVHVRRKNGKDKFWSAQPQMKWYILKFDEDRAKQRSLREF